MSEAKPRSKAYRLDRVDRSELLRSTAKIGAAAVVTIVPLLAMGFDTNTTIGAVGLMVVRQISELAARWLRNNDGFSV